MPITTRPPRTKCYFHEVLRPPDLAYNSLQHHVCWICQSRLLELAKSNYRFELRERVVAVSFQTEAEPVAA